VPADPDGAVQALRDALPRLEPFEGPFALGLVSYWEEHGFLSPKQWYWVLDLAERARTRAPPNVIVRTLTQDRRVIAALAGEMAGLAGADLDAYRVEARRHYELQLVDLGVPRAWARQDVTALLAMAEALLKEQNNPGTPEGDAPS
jgi:hypothetical protein